MIKQVKTGMKAVLALTLALVLGFAGLEVRAQDIASGNGWSLDSKGHLIIENDEGMKEWVEEYSPVHYKEVKSAEIEYGVTYVGYQAFFETGIKEIILPESIVTIGDEAFKSCYELKSITIPSSVTLIEGGAFKASGLKEAVIEGGPSVEGYAFGCDIDKITLKSEQPSRFYENAFRNDSIMDSDRTAKNYASQITFQIPQGTTDNYKEALKNTGYDESKLVEEMVTAPEPGSGTEEEKPDSSQPGSGTEEEKPDSSQPGSGTEGEKPDSSQPGSGTEGEKPDSSQPGSGTEEEKPDSSQPGSGTEEEKPDSSQPGSGTEEEKPDSSQPGSGTEEEKPDSSQPGSGTEEEKPDSSQPGSNSQSKPEIETPSDKENTSGMITNSPMAEGNRAVGTETGYYPQDRKEEQIPKISYVTTSSVAGQKSTVSGVFILNKGINVAVRTPQEQLKADFLLETNERLFAKILDMDLKKSNLAKASLDSIMASVGGKPVAYLNIEMGTMKNGVYKGITESDKTISYAVEISSKDNLEKFDVIRVREGGKLDILKSQYSKGVITFETTPALGAYLIISY